MHFHAIFKSFSLILQTDFFFFSGNFAKTAGATYICEVILSLPLIQEGPLSVSGERMCTVLVNHFCIHKPTQEMRLCKLTGSKIT